MYIRVCSGLCACVYTNSPAAVGMSLQPLHLHESRKRYIVRHCMAALLHVLSACMIALLFGCCLLFLLFGAAEAALALSAWRQC